MILYKKCLAVSFFCGLAMFSSAILQGQNNRPHVVFIAGEEEYGAHWTLPKIADDLQRRFNIRSTVIHSWRSGAHDYDMPGEVEIPQYEEIDNLEIIKEADLIVMHIRFRLLPPEQLQIMQEYFDSGKPAIAFRTTSHGMWAADQKDWFVPFFGGHYKGHMPNTQGTTTMVPADQLDHPILKGVPKRHSMNDIMGIYVTAPLNDSTVPLMMGKTGLIGPAQPVTWTNEYQPGQKIFYTSLGGLESFVDPGFINMVYNAVYWTLNREIPEHGVLGIDNLSFWEEEPPFERYGFGLLNENPFERPEEELEPENAIVLEADFKSPDIPTAPDTKIPADAVVLFDGTALSSWRHWDLSDEPVAMLPDARAVSPSPEFKGPRWPIIDNAVEAKPGYGSLLTKEEFGNYRLHLDFLVPAEPDYIPAKFKGSGSIFLDGRFEIKILDSFEQQPSTTSNGSVFNQVAPTSNPSKPANTWQSLDIEYRHYQGRRPVVSIALNGVKIHNNVTILSRAPFAIREDIALYQSSEKDGSGKFNMNVDNWGAEIRFRTLDGGYLLTNAPENQPWNDDSKGWAINEGKLFFRNGSNYQRIKVAEGLVLNDGNWHNVLLSAKDGLIGVYVDGKHTDQVENTGSTTFEGHILRIGQATKHFRLGASELPNPFRGETFNGEIARVRFYNQNLDEVQIKKMSSDAQFAKESIVLDWNQESKVLKTGPIRLQSDLSRIRYANIWLQPLEK